MSSSSSFVDTPAHSPEKQKHQEKFKSCKKKIPSQIIKKNDNLFYVDSIIGKNRRNGQTKYLAIFLIFSDNNH